MDVDLRWLQRLSNYRKALSELQEAVALSKTRAFSKLEKQGLIQCFEYTHELARKTLKDFLESQGAVDLFGSKDVIREAFKFGIITQGEIWMDMIKRRNQTSHIYDEIVVDNIATLILTKYFSEFQLLSLTFDKIQKKERDFS